MKKETKFQKAEFIELECLECGKKEALPLDSIYFTIAGLNYFCSGDCEDKYAFKQ